MIDTIINNPTVSFASSKADVYKKFFSNDIKFFESDQKLRQVRKQSDGSYAFVMCPGEVFGIVNPSFCKSFHDVTNGEGQEKFKIYTLHSSSLLGLLCFYKVGTSGLTVTLPFGGKDITFQFTEVVFEKTNPVFSKSNGKSSIDIALYGEANGEKVALYLESKFTEYLHRGGNLTSDKKSQYKPFYDVLQKSLKDIEYSNINNDGNEDGKLHLNGKEKEHYCEGIKQMVSHFVGALHTDDWEERGIKKIYLATILFDFSKYGFGSEEIDDYNEQYGQLSNGLNELKSKIENNKSGFFEEKVKNRLPIRDGVPSNIIISDKVFTYQDFFSKSACSGYELDPLVKDFYQL